MLVPRDRAGRGCRGSGRRFAGALPAPAPPQRSGRMEDNEPATATSGAVISAEMGQTEGASGTEAVIEEIEQDDYREENARLRRRHLQLNYELDQARKAGDHARQGQLLAERGRVLNTLVENNIGLVMHFAQPFLVGDRETRQDHQQAALLGLWESIVGRNPQDIDAYRLDESGKVRAAAGWDPEQGSLAAWAKQNVRGRTARSVRQTEAEFTGISYSTWTEKPKVDRAKRELTEKLGRTPTHAEVAEAAGVTVETVRACSTATPLSLHAPTGEDGDSTLADRLANTAQEDTTVSAQDAERLLARRAASMSAQDIFVMLLRFGLLDTPARTGAMTAALLGVGRGTVQNAVRRVEDALVPPLTRPEDITCGRCRKAYRYPADAEPKLVLTTPPMPDVSDKPLSEARRIKAAYYEKAGMEHERQKREHLDALAAFRTAERAKARKFEAAHAHRVSTPEPLDATTAATA